MTVYFVKTKGWRYDFTLKGERITASWFKTKREALDAESRRREEIKENPVVTLTEAGPEKLEIPTGITFLELVNRRLDHLKDHRTCKYYVDCQAYAKRWVRKWGNFPCSEITEDMIMNFLRQRKNVSGYTGNMEIRLLKATFNHGIKKKLIQVNPLSVIEFFPVEKRLKYVPSAEDIDRVINIANPEDQDYLWVIRETMGRISEINRLTWDDVDLAQRFVVLYTRKKKGGSLTPRKVPMTGKLYEILSRRHAGRDVKIQWVFWHRYWDRQEGKFVTGPYKDRKKLMKKLCEKAGVRYFRYHPLRHAGASTMDRNNVPIGSIQRCKRASVLKKI